MNKYKIIMLGSLALVLFAMGFIGAINFIFDATLPLTFKTVFGTAGIMFIIMILTKKGN